MGEVVVVINLTWTHFSVTRRLLVTLCGDTSSKLNPMALSGTSKISDRGDGDDVPSINLSASGNFAEICRRGEDRRGVGRAESSFFPASFV
ncbi:hypothetical protein CRG98_036537 [Punica granatum]|uniref:Uncharacterized protein n=1 Tax=Punica granatum TaxID=22663 RepID=A0A2I0IGG2_PUNGR|nr:hypothetical protein CRG98_036537 [Punica granatum]